MGPLFFVFLNISIRYSFGGVDRNICGTVALYNENNASSWIGTVAEIPWYDWVLRGVDSS